MSAFDAVRRQKRFEDCRPYDIPESLDCLCGPDTECVTLPIWIYWQHGSKTFSLADSCQVKNLYQAVISEASARDQVKFLNKEKLIEIWPTLSLPIKVAKMWEENFSELNGNMRASWSIEVRGGNGVVA